MNRLKNIALLIILLACCYLPAHAQTDSTKTAATDEEKAAEYRLHNDWANLEYYRDDNKRLAVNKNNRVLFMGDSITELWAETDSPFFAAHSNYIDRGISGQTTPQMLLRFRQDVIALKPKVVIILGGTNDIAGNTGPETIDEVFGYLVSMMQLAKANHIKVVIASVLPVYEYFWNPDVKPAGKIIELNNRLKAYAAKHNIVYLDYYTPMKDERQGLKKNLTKDGVHPNLAGYKVMEHELKKALTLSLSNSR